MSDNQAPTGSLHKNASDAKDAVQSAAGHVQDTLADAKASAKNTMDDSVKALHGRADDAREAASSFSDSAGEQIGQVKQAAAQQVDQAKQAASQQVEQVKGQIDQAKQTAAQQVEQARQAATQQFGQAKQTTGEQLDQAKQAADSGATQAGTQLTDLAGTLREKTRTLDDNSPLTAAAAKAADALDGAGSYLQATGPDDWVTDLKRQIERRPIAAVLIAAVIGFLLSRTTGGPRMVVVNRDYPQQAPVTLPPEA